MDRPKKPRGQCRRLLMALAVSDWAAPAPLLGLHLNMLNYRARITDLRQRWGIPIKAESEIVNGRKHTVYTVPQAARQRAAELLADGGG